MKFVYLLLALAFLKCVIVYKVMRSVPYMELKRRARTGDRRARALFKISAYEASLDMLLWLAGTASAAILLIWSARTSWLLAAIVTAIASWVLIPARFSAWGWAGGVTAFAAAYYAAVLSFLDPVLKPFARFTSSGASSHTGVYEKKDLLELLKAQSSQPDSRVSPEDLKIAYSALSFGDKTVGQVMTPRKAVKFVQSGEPIGPILVDELHKSGFSCFPVVKEIPKSSAPDILGTLYLDSLIGYEGDGKVKDVAKDDVSFINEDCTLSQALDAFLKAHHHLLVVVNAFEEMVGVLTLDDVLERLLGKRTADGNDNYSDLRAAASMAPKTEQAE